MAPGLLKSISTMDVRLPSHPSIYVIAALLISYAIYYTYSWIQLERERTAIKAQHGCLPAPPRDRAWDIFGLYALYELVTSASQHRLLEMFAKKFKQYGTTYSGVRRGKAVIATMDAEVFKTIHATKFDDWAVEEPRSAFHPLLGRGVFTTDGSAWHQSRSVLRPQFEKQQVAELGQFEPHVKKLIAKIPTDGSTVDLQDLFHKLTMDTSSEFLSGTSTGLLDEEYNVAGHQFADAFEFGCYDGIMRARLGRLYWLVPHFKAGKAIKVSRRYVDQWVKDALKYKQNDEKRSSKKEPYVFLRSLSMDERVNSRQMADEMLNIMLAGRDTTASLLSSMFFVLAREPEIEKKLRAEVDEFGGELPTYERLRDMKYIRYFAQEGQCYRTDAIVLTIHSAPSLSTCSSTTESCGQGHSHPTRWRT